MLSVGHLLIHSHAVILVWSAAAGCQLAGVAVIVAVDGAESPRMTKPLIVLRASILPVVGVPRLTPVRISALIREGKESLRSADRNKLRQQPTG